MILPRIEPTSNEGVILPPQTKFANQASIGKDYLRRIVEGGEKLIYSMKISYSDLERYDSKEYTSYYEVKLVEKDPPTFNVQLAAKNNWGKPLQ